MKNRLGLFAISLAVVCLCFPFGSSAQDDDDRQGRRQTRIKWVGGEQYWLGIVLAPLEDTLKAQLDIEGGVVVEKVLEDSPAEETGVKPHDVVIKLGEHTVANPEDLLKAVRENKQKRTTLTVIRQAKARTLDIQPTKAPENLSMPVELQKDVRTHVQRWLNNYVEKGIEQPLRMQFVGPGVFGYEREVAEMPENLSVTIKKTGDKPAEIVVKQDDKTWEVTEANLDELPGEIADHVRKLLGGGGRAGLRLKTFRPGNARIVIERQRDDGTDDKKTTRREHNERAFVVPDDFRDLRKNLEQMRRQLQGDVLQEIRKELKSLRREVEQLRSQLKDG